MVFGLTLASAAPALAGEDSGTLYGNLRAIGFATKSGAESGATGGATGAMTDSGEIAGVAGILGYSFGRFPFRAEVEVARRFRFDIDTPEGTAPAADRESNPAGTSALASAIVEWRNDSDFTPFAGVSAGWAWNPADSGRLDLSGPGTAENDAATDSFAYGGILGFDLGLGENLSAGVAYRYLNLGNGDSGSIDAADSVSTDDYISHDVLLSILYRF
jgi:opacity protein-like surface antigen